MNDEAMFDCSVVKQGDVTTLHVRGELDSYASPAFRECLDRVLEEGGLDVVVDMSETRFLDSSALGVLVASLKRFRAAGGDLRLAHPNPNIAEVLDLTGLTKVFTIEP